GVALGMSHATKGTFSSISVEMNRTLRASWPEPRDHWGVWDRRGPLAGPRKPARPEASAGSYPSDVGTPSRQSGQQSKIGESDLRPREIEMLQRRQAGQRGKIGDGPEAEIEMLQRRQAGQRGKIGDLRLPEIE